LYLIAAVYRLPPRIRAPAVRHRAADLALVVLERLEPAADLAIWVGTRWGRCVRRPRSNHSLVRRLNSLRSTRSSQRLQRRQALRFVELCRKMGLLANASVAIDGSKFKAVNNRDRNFTRAKVERRRAQLEESLRAI
jgi:hypothetical protein